MTSSLPATFGFSALVACGLALTACSSSPKDTTPAVADAGSTTPPGSSTQAVPTGANCNSLTETYSICDDLSSCPGVSIDQTKFPNCGYSVHDDAIDPECLCYGSMCPMGAPGTCTDMAALLATTTADEVCLQYAAGHCLDLGGSSQSQCAVCKQNCAGNPTCLSACGC
jgi:hypothetical protein